MKQFLFLAFVFCIGLNTLTAQSLSGDFTLSVVTAEEVPSAVKEAQAAHFPDNAVRQWKMQSASARSRQAASYVASFHLEGANTRARYTANGQGTTAYTVYRLQHLPAEVIEAVRTSYPDAKITGLAKITSLHRDWVGYRVSLRQQGSKTIIWLNLDGQVISPDSIPSEVEDETLSE